MLFESFANSERYKTTPSVPLDVKAFESFANSERYKTNTSLIMFDLCLRALLIQKDTKLYILNQRQFYSLRALLIQKDTKPDNYECSNETCLRALLIQKDTKLRRSVRQNTIV